MAPNASPQPLSPSEVLRTRYRKRLPGHLGELDGPTQGTVDLPLHVVWSGRTSFVLDRPKSRMTLYRTVLTEGQRDDLIAYLDASLLIDQWPVLRRLVSPHLRDVWEDAFPELARQGAAAA
ncbi:hypothetical protein [Streptomyces sp. NPDC050145]|uniref:hypothetical protein n=1 Tax=Streptomyces sp. NPDC050145 TaxID=3365602 RepID=UPI003791D713